MKDKSLKDSPKIALLAGIILPAGFLGLCFVLPYYIDAQPGPISPASNADIKISYYQKKLTKDEGLYPAHAQLGLALLEKAQNTFEPTYVKMARAAMTRSLQIQTNFLALRAMASVSNYSHRFEEGLSWAIHALKAHPNDPRTIALQVEALMGLGQYSKAGQVLSLVIMPKANFYVEAANAQWLASQDRADEAVTSLLRAAKLAREEDQKEMVLWAFVSAAGVLLDNSRHNEAGPLLNTAIKMSPQDRLAKIHVAELLEAKDQLTEALAQYESLLEGFDDPQLHAQAHRLARKLGSPRAAYHFQAAKKGYQAAIDAGEKYTLGALARLFASANVELEKAHRLAQENLRYKRDHEAKATAQRLRLHLNEEK